MHIERYDLAEVQDVESIVPAIAIGAEYIGYSYLSKALRVAGERIDSDIFIQGAETISDEYLVAACLIDYDL